MAGIATAEEDYRRWQLRAYRTLGELLDIGLPVIDWQITHLGYVVGRVHKRIRGGPVEQQEQWQEWADRLAATIWKTESEGTVNLHADAKGWGKYKGDVFILATILHDDDESD